MGSAVETREPDIWALYTQMLRCRLYEEAVADLWQHGLISGEMHLGTGEEAVAAGVVSQLRDNDAMALDHRGTAALLLRGVDPVALAREFLGQPDGLCRGQGGHMHLFSKQHLAASSGIVGAAGPAAAGFALAGKRLRPGSISVAFFGEGATNQGMLMESMNLAAVLGLPVLFVCKDDGWAITMRREGFLAGTLSERVRGLGVRYVQVDGLNVIDVWRAASEAIAHARSGLGPTFLHASCVHLEAHFLGLQLLRIARHPVTEMPAETVAMSRSLFARGGASVAERLAGLRQVMFAIDATRRDPRSQPENDPLLRARAMLEADPDRLADAENRTRAEIAETFDRVTDGIVT